MDRQKTWARHRRWAFGVLICGLLGLWATPGLSIDVVRKSAQPVRTAPPSAQKEPQRKTTDTTAASLHLLLDDVESQKKNEGGTDTLDTWIDRDGDGVNDRLKKSTTSGVPVVRGSQPTRDSKPEKEKTAVDESKKTKSSRPEPAAKKRHR